MLCSVGSYRTPSVMKWSLKHPLLHDNQECNHHKSVNLRARFNQGWRMEKIVSSPAVVGGLEGGVTQTCALLCLPCRTGRQRAMTGTALSVIYQATSSRVTTASGSTISSVYRRSASPETAGRTGSVSSAGQVVKLGSVCPLKGLSCLSLND